MFLIPEKFKSKNLEIKTFWKKISRLAKKMKNFAGIKFHGWPKFFISQEINFANDPLNREIREI